MSKRLERVEPLPTPVEAATGAAGARSVRTGAWLVGGGILLSRLFGLVRDRVLAAYFGTGLHADVFSAGLRMPNLLQNLLGEGTLSASFIPVYSELLSQGRKEEAGRLAGAVFALLLAIAAAFSLIGVALAPVLVSIFTPGFEGERRELMIIVTRILFPMTGVLVLSAWALGILNSHRKFFVPYFAPVLWNAAIIGAFVAFGSRLDLNSLLIAAAWGAFLGGVLQFAIQLPWVIRLERQFRVGGRQSPAFREVLRNAGPAVLGRGVVQLGSYLDMVLASLLAVGAVARLRFAQTLYLLPISLFAMSVAAAALPELARQREAPGDSLRTHVNEAVERVAFYVVPSLIAFTLLGHVFVAGLFKTGEFGDADVLIVWLTLAAYSLGLLASTTSRIYQSAFFALRDTKTPARIAGLRVAVSVLAGAFLMVQFESVSIGGLELAGLFKDFTVNGIPLGPVGLALGAAVGAWVEWTALVARLRHRLGKIGVSASAIARMLAAALGAAAAGYAVHSLLEDIAPLAAAAGVAAVYGSVYFGAAHLLRLREAGEIPKMIRQRLGGGKH